MSRECVWKAQHGREPGTEQAGPKEPDRHTETRARDGTDGLALLRVVEIGHELDDVFREAIGAHQRVAAQSNDRGRVSARGSAHTEVNSSRIQGFQRPELLRDAHIYLMLHGSDFDAERFWGEEEDGHLEAINCEVLPEQMSGVVFAGCCWGALIGREPAYRVVTDDPPLTRRIEDSMALSALARGASAFVGCTGAHYSPVKKPYNYYGHPMHASFWSAIGRGLAPATCMARSLPSCSSPPT